MCASCEFRLLQETMFTTAESTQNLRECAEYVRQLAFVRKSSVWQRLSFFPDLGDLMPGIISLWLLSSVVDNGTPSVATVATVMFSQ